MILRLKIIKRDGLIIPTNIFSVVGDLDYTKFSNVLERIQYFVSDKRNSLRFFDYSGMLPFEITDNGSKYEYALMGHIDEIIDIETVEKAVEEATRMTIKDMSSVCRSHYVYKPRVVLFAAVRFFNRMTAVEMMGRYGKDRTTILHATNKALPQFMNSNDDMILSSIRAIAEKFNNSMFLTVCETGSYPRR